MRVSGNGNVNLSAAALGMEAGGQADPMCRDLQNQIENLKQQMKDLSSRRDLSDDMKRKKRQELQKQVSDLEMQLRQRQMEVKREEVMKKKESRGNGMDEMLGVDNRQTKKQGGKSAGLSPGSMSALISADTAMQQADVHGGIAQQMEGKAGVLKAEIQLDSMSGGASAVAGKKEQLAEVEAKAAEATSAQMGAVAQAGEAVKEAAEADKDSSRTEEKTDQSGKMDQKEEGTHKAKQKADAQKGAADPADTDAKSADPDTAQQTGGQPQNTFDTAMPGVPFSRGRQSVDVKL